MKLNNGMLDERMEKKRKSKPIFDPDEETEEEMWRPDPVFLNQNKNVFDRFSLNGSSGINSAPSVFDKAAIFHTKK